MSPEGQVGTRLVFMAFRSLIICLWIRRWTRRIAAEPFCVRKHRRRASISSTAQNELAICPDLPAFAFVCGLLEFVESKTATGGRQNWLLLFFFVCPSVFLISGWTQTKRRLPKQGTAAASSSQGVAASPTPPPLPANTAVTAPISVPTVPAKSSRHVAIWILSGVAVIGVIGILLFAVAQKFQPNAEDRARPRGKLFITTAHRLDSETGRRSKHWV